MACVPVLPRRLVACSGCGPAGHPARVYGDDCSGHFAGDANTESTEDGARFSGRRDYRTAHRGALLYVYYPVDPAKYAVALYQLGGAGIYYRHRSTKRRLGSLGTLASTINIIVLSNPMIFNVRQFLDSALGQIVGCFVSLIVLLLIRDNAKDRTGRTLLNRFVYSAVSA